MDERIDDIWSSNLSERVNWDELDENNPIKKILEIINGSIKIWDENDLNYEAEFERKFTNWLVSFLVWDFYSAIGIFEELKNETNEKKGEILALLWICYYEIKCFKKAKEILNEALKKQSENIFYIQEVNYTLWTIYLEEKDYKKALIFFQQATIWKNHEITQKSFLWVWYTSNLLKKYYQARQAFEKALNWPNDSITKVAEVFIRQIDDYSI